MENYTKCMTKVALLGPVSTCTGYKYYFSECLAQPDKLRAEGVVTCNKYPIQRW